LLIGLLIIGILITMLLPLGSRATQAAPISTITVASVTLINADTDQPIPGYEAVTGNLTLDLAKLPTRKLSLRANTNPARVGSVQFALAGKAFKTENHPPYTIAGDAPTKAGRNYLPWPLPAAGEHMLTLTPYTQTNGQGTPGVALKLRVTVKDGAPAPTTTATATAAAPTATTTATTVAPTTTATATAVAPTATALPTGAKRWFASLPTSGDVTVKAGETVLLDTNVDLKGLQIDGTLICADQDLSLRANWIMVHGSGKLQCGTAQQPFTKQLTITLTGSKTGANVMGCGEKFLCVMMGATLELHGTPRLSWTRINATAEKGATQITLDKAPDWRAGDRLVIASTDFDPLQAEEVTVKAVSGATVSFEPALKYQHFGQTQTFDGKTIENRAEVALLNRNIVIEGEEATSKDGFGGHIMIMDKSQARLQNVEITRMGQKAILRRYALHYHLLFDEGQKSYLKNTAIHHTFNRCVVVHGTNKLLLERNTCYDNIGHAYFLEDGAEVENQFIENLGLVTRAPVKGQEVIKADLPEFGGPATFWITNPRNTFRGNVAAGSDGIGFWFSMPGRVMGLVGEQFPNKFPSPMGEWKLDFTHNVAHSNRSGVFQDGCLQEDGTTAGCYYGPIREQATALGVEPKPSDSRLRVTYAGPITAYKNDLGIWNRAFYQRYNDVRLADNGAGMILACGECEVNGGVIAGETANKGNPKPGVRTGPLGHTLPTPDAREYEQRLVGFRFYDSANHLKNLTFANFVHGNLSDGSPRAETAAISVNTTFAGGHTTQGIRFVNVPEAARVGMGFGGAQFDFEDLDGSVVGVPASVSAGAASMADAQCTQRTTTGSYPRTFNVCPRNTGKYRFAELWWYDGEYPGGNIPTAITREGGGTFKREYEDRLKFDISAGNRVTFRDGTLTPGTTMKFDALRPNDTFRLEVPYAQQPTSIFFGGAYFGPLSSMRTDVTAASSRAAMTPNTYFYDAGTKTLYLYLKPHYLDYAFNQGYANLTVR
jgi:hypothetical protein